jgi:hypothetical protein
LVRIFLATIKAPTLNYGKNEDPEPYAWDAKEHLRKTAIGKKVKVVMEFSRTIEGKLGN